MKKTVKFLILTIAIMLVATACAQTQQEETFNIDFMQGTDGILDLDGFSMRYAITPSTLYGDTSASNVLGFASDTLFSDLAAERIDYVENTHNCTIDAFYAKDDASISSFNNLSLAGVFYCDAIQGTAEQLRSSAKAGLCYMINLLDAYIDYTDSAKWGTKEMLEPMCYNGDLYGVVPAAWPELNYTSFGYAFVANMNLASILGISDLREVVENNEWNWDRFEKTLVEGTVMEGSETKYYGMVCHPQYLGEMLLRSNGDTLITKNEDGTFSCGYFDQHAMTALDEFQKVYKGEYSYCFNQDKTYPEDAVDFFVEGTSVLTVCDTEHIYGYNGRISKEVENFAILPSPTGPDVPADYRFSIFESMRSTISFSVLSQNPEASAYIVNAIYEPLDGYETMDDIKSFMSHNYFFDDRDADIFFSMFENTSFNYFCAGMRAIVDNIVESDYTIAQILDTNKDIFSTNIEKEVVSARETMDTLWPEKN